MTAASIETTSMLIESTRTLINEPSDASSYRRQIGGKSQANRGPIRVNRAGDCGDDCLGGLMALLPCTHGILFFWPIFSTPTPHRPVYYLNTRIACLGCRGGNGKERFKWVAAALASVDKIPCHPHSLCGERLLGTHLRNCLVSATATGDRLLLNLFGRVAGLLHGRDVYFL